MAMLSLSFQGSKVLWPHDHLLYRLTLRFYRRLIRSVHLLARLASQVLHRSRLDQFGVGVVRGAGALLVPLEDRVCQLVELAGGDSHVLQLLDLLHGWKAVQSATVHLDPL